MISLFVYNLSVYDVWWLSGCLDMVAVEGQFTFTAERPQLSCAAFFMAEPTELLSVDYDSVDIDCRGGDFLTVPPQLLKTSFILTDTWTCFSVRGDEAGVAFCFCLPPHAGVS